MMRDSMKNQATMSVTEGFNPAFLNQFQQYMIEKNLGGPNIVKWERVYNVFISVMQTEIDLLTESIHHYLNHMWENGAMNDFFTQHPHSLEKYEELIKENLRLTICHSLAIEPVAPSLSLVLDPACSACIDACLCAFSQCFSDNFIEQLWTLAVNAMPAVSLLDEHLIDDFLFLGHGLPTPPALVLDETELSDVLLEPPSVSAFESSLDDYPVPYVSAEALLWAWHQNYVADFIPEKVSFTTRLVQHVLTATGTAQKQEARQFLLNQVKTFYLEHCLRQVSPLSLVPCQQLASSASLMSDSFFFSPVLRQQHDSILWTPVPMTPSCEEPSPGRDVTASVASTGILRNVQSTYFSPDKQNEASPYVGGPEEELERGYLNLTPR